MSNVDRTNVVDSRFEMIGIVDSDHKISARPSISYWKDARIRLVKNKVAMFGLIIIVATIIMSLIGPWLTPYSYNQTNLMNINAPVSSEHWFGTDTLGRDLWARIWMGARVSLAVGIVGAILPSLLGMVIGGISGYFGGKVDMILMRITDIGMCVPQLIYVILIMIYFGSGPIPIIMAFAITGWMGSARNIRGLVLQLKEREFILASKALGASSMRLIFKHLIPNTLSILIVSMTMAIPSAIFYEAYLSFIGIGIKPPMSSWGQLVNSGISVFQIYPSQLFIPAALISFIMLSFNLFGDGLRDALDPKLRN
ncbi:ABC transporter permease [Paenibacillus endoradicis]|uniref:ABC transporter permease n=1 Tax=Paenibacillus endoradicis TaxID=2972487 RepID=UPI0021591ADE|nr:ABC transporter permease [Paenibacillus endoradicis]MCR8656792.1 ABC transporter permease [Paenibacillus endoradicis]